MEILEIIHETDASWNLSLRSRVQERVLPISGGSDCEQSD